MVETIIVTEDTDLEVTTPTFYKFEFPNSITKTTVMKILQEGSYTLRAEGIVFNKADVLTTSWKLKFKCL